MSLRRSILSAATLAAPLFLGAATIAGAQSSRQLFTWTGRVDREVQIAMRGRDVWTRSGDRNEQSYNRARVESALPRSDGYVRVQQVDGRGDVAVIQQPNSRNDYTTIVRMRDRSGGADRYRISASWDASYSDDRGAYGRGNGRGPRVEPRDRSSDRNDGGWDNGNGNNDSNGGWDRRNGNGGYGNGGYGNNRTVLHWSGVVDKEVEIRLQDRRVDYRTLGGSETRNVRSDVIGGLPRRDVQLIVDQRQGRGSVIVVQNPSAWNGYTAVLRVRDPQSGAAYYDFDLEAR